MRTSVPDLLTFNGGYVDAAGFLALQGLFTAHVTGNFVTIGASLVQGTSGVLAKLLALPVFCVVVVLARLFSERLSRTDGAALSALLLIKVLLFAIAAALFTLLGPFNSGDSIAAITTGMTLVAAMAIQNAVHRIFFPKSPPTTLMTGSTTQVMMDVADLMGGRLTPEVRAAARTRCRTLVTSICIFGVGCAVAAIVYARVGRTVFFLPPVVAALAFLPHLRPGETRQTG